MSLIYFHLQQDEVEDSDVDEVEEEEEEEDEKITRNWSVLKSTPQLRKSKVFYFFY